MSTFQLSSEFVPKGDQPEAIRRLADGYAEGKRHQVLLGVTGSGKTFTMANLIQELQRPTLVISHNKTLAAQLYSEFKEFFPNSAVAYFVSYYDYYQPEAYIPQRDIYIEKDASINEEIDRLRLRATTALMTRRDVVIVASVSCIYGLGSPEDFQEMYVHLRKGQEINRDEILCRLVNIQYERNDYAFERGRFRVRGDVIDVYPADEEVAFRIEMFGDEIDQLSAADPLTGEALRAVDEIEIYPAKHFVMPEGRIEQAIHAIEAELEERLEELRAMGKLLEAQRLEARTRYDMELMLEVGYCPGIENYSRHLSGREPGQRPYTLIDYFPDDFFTIVDESHVSLPQFQGMYHNDRTRKKNLVDYGFRLPSAFDNRPMSFEEWEGSVNQVLFVSATPGPYELRQTDGEVVEQIIRPTGLVDPIIHVKPATGQVADLLQQIHKRVERNERALVTTLTKRMAEDLSEYVREEGFRCQYLHSEIDTIERVEILRELRLGEFDVLIGVNLLREGLDLPEVSLVAILDADKEGFLRSATSLIQTIGRTARNVNAEVVLYADKVTDSMRRAIDETKRRRDIQEEHNEKHGITPETVKKRIRGGIQDEIAARQYARLAVHESEEEYVTMATMAELEAEMREAADNLDFERAAEIRDRIVELQKRMGAQEAKPARRRPSLRPEAERGRRSNESAYCRP